MTARLHTARGHVANVEVPPFESGYPPAIAWRERFYLRMPGAPEDGEYLEVFCWAATVEVREREADLCD